MTEEFASRSINIARCSCMIYHVHTFVFLYSFSQIYSPKFKPSQLDAIREGKIAGRRWVPAWADISHCAVRWVLICCWRPEQSSLSYRPPPHPRTRRPLANTSPESLSVTHKLHHLDVFRSNRYLYPTASAGSQSSKAISHSVINLTKSLGTSDRGVMSWRGGWGCCCCGHIQRWTSTFPGP